MTTASTTATMSASLLEAMVEQARKGKEKPAAAAAPTPPVPSLTAHVPTYAGNTKPFSKVFGFKPPSGIDHAVPVFAAEDWHEKVREFIPVFDTGYIFPKEATEEAVVALIGGERTLAYGPKGSGKSDLGQQIAAKLGVPWIRVNCREDMESSALFGNIVFQDKGMQWVDGPAAELGQYGGILQIDEISATPAGIALAMQWMLEAPGKARIYLADKPAESKDKYIVPHNWFRVFATDNTQLSGDVTGKYLGTNPQNEALADRFTTFVNVNYMDPKDEVKVILSRVPSIPKDIAEKMVDLATVVRNDYNKGNVQVNMSVRVLLSWAEKSLYWGNIRKAFELSFLRKLEEKDRKTVAEYMFKRFGK